MEKKCCVCHEAKDFSDFGPSKSSKDGKQSKCIICNRKQARLHYNANKEKHFERAMVRKRKIRNALNLVKEKAGCCFCGESCALCLDFHHTDSGTKEVEVSCVSTGLKRLIEEIKKCEVVCANCHRKIHGGLIQILQTRQIDTVALQCCLK